MSTSSPRREQIVIFTRFPEPGFAKTRLIPKLGPMEAANLQKRMTENIVAQAMRFAEEKGVQVEIRYQDGSKKAMKNWLGPDYHYQAQGEGDLGVKMNRALTEAFRNGTKAVLIIGTDCPSISKETINKALTALLTHDLVLGPANDGGYYLIGLSQEAPELFKNIPWGSDKVLQSTLDRAGQSRLSFSLVEKLTDIDRPEDLASLPDFLKP